jgi:hypothetical protein
MKLLEWLRKGFGYVLMSMGASSPDAIKKKPGTPASPKPGPRT